MEMADVIQLCRYSRDMKNTLADLGIDEETLGCLLQGISYCPVLEGTTEGVPVRKLFVGNLAQRTTCKDVEELFSVYGKVESCYLKRSNAKTNFAFVTFSNEADALKARHSASLMTIQLHCRILRVSPADSWHQPDSVENSRKYMVKHTVKEGRNEEEISQDTAAIHNLNDDCLMEIFLHLPIADRIRMERVCKRWQATSRESWRAVKHLNLSRTSWGLGDKVSKQFVDTAALRQVLLRCGRFLNHIDFWVPHDLGPSALTIVGNFCPNLRTVDISGVNLSQSGIRSLAQNCRNIYKFSMKALTGSCENDLAQLFAVNKKLKYLRIDEGVNISGKCLAHLPSDSIEEISIFHGMHVASCHLDAAIKKCETLKKLTLSDCVTLSGKSLYTIATRETLTTLKLCGHLSIISTAEIEQIAKLVNLENLTFQKNYYVTDAFLQLIAANCKRLSTLDIYGCKFVTNEGLVGVATLPKLRNLVISCIPGVTDESLATMQNLEKLECHECLAIEDDGVATLIETATKLEWLDVSGCFVTNKIIQVAIRATKKRKNNILLKIIVGATLVKSSEITDVSPLLQIVNVLLPTF